MRSSRIDYPSQIRHFHENEPSPSSSSASSSSSPSRRNASGASPMSLLCVIIERKSHHCIQFSSLPLPVSLHSLLSLCCTNSIDTTIITRRSSPLPTLTSTGAPPPPPPPPGRPPADTSDTRPRHRMYQHRCRARRRRRRRPPPPPCKTRVWGAVAQGEAVKFAPYFADGERSKVGNYCFPLSSSVVLVDNYTPARAIRWAQGRSCAAREP